MCVCVSACLPGRTRSRTTLMVSLSLVLTHGLSLSLSLSLVFPSFILSVSLSLLELLVSSERTWLASWKACFFSCRSRNSSCSLRMNSSSSSSFCRNGRVSSLSSPLLYSPLLYHPLLFVTLPSPLSSLSPPRILSLSLPSFASHPVRTLMSSSFFFALDGAGAGAGAGAGGGVGPSRPDKYKHRGGTKQERERAKRK